ncbi:hypothetical protein [Haloarchaeobius iranensis]|uniref:Envelope protein N-terminal domain-containing protein n=1 Tax=Haloarchaeobius iranensis TaxID=996166 RepID=A0A1G9XHX3_9EURY|nr:hypothetical protein [Haloarchaeobius iranensis]SDM95883.1 hypothetical protein SAMN05192554_110119 [Haloarchaeobius iranensis]
MKARVMVMAALLLSTALVGPAMAASAPAAGSTGAEPVDRTTAQPEPPEDPVGGCNASVAERAMDFGLKIAVPAYAAYDIADSSDECNVGEILQGNKEQEKGDIHSEAEKIRANQEAAVTGVHNSLNDARTIAWTKAECATLDALEANATQAETRVQARAAVEDYYSRMLHNFVQERNQLMYEMSYLHRVQNSEDLASNVSEWEFDWARNDISVQNRNRTATERLNYTLPNGSTVAVVTPEWVVHYNDFANPDDITVHFWWDSSSQHHPDGFRYQSHYNGDVVTAYNSTRIDQIVDRIESQNQQMLDNLNYTVNGLYGSYLRGNLNISDYRSVQCTADEVGRGVEGTYYSIYAVTALAKAGAETPNLSTTGSMTIATSQFNSHVNNSTEEFTGLLVGTTAPDGGWQVGETYDPATINGSVSFHVSDSNRSFYLTEPFTLVGAEDESGGDISSVNTTQYQYRTSNFSELGDKLDRLIQLRMEEQEEIEEAANPGDGGTIGWPGLGGAGGLALGGSLATLAIAAILVGIGVKLYIEVMTP